MDCSIISRIRGLFALAQLFWLLPAIIIALPLLRRPHERDANRGPTTTIAASLPSLRSVRP